MGFRYEELNIINKSQILNPKSQIKKMLISCNKIPNTKLSCSGKKNLEFDFELTDSIAKVNEAHWSNIVQYGSPFLNIPYLKVMEYERPDNMSFHYATIYNDDKPVAIAYFQVVNFSSETFDSFIDRNNTEVSCAVTNYLKKYLTNQLLRNVNKVNMRLLICGNAFVSGEHGFSCVPGMNKAEIFDVLADIIYQINEAEKHKGKIAAVLVKDFSSSAKEVADELKEFKYHDFLVEPNMLVNIQWSSFDDYLNAMSKKYRNRAKTIIKKGSDIQRKQFTELDIEANAAVIQALYNNVHQKATFRMAALSTDYFVKMKKVLKEQFCFVAYYNNEELIGFRTSFILPDSVEAHFIGLNYQLNKELELYQNILYDYIKETIDSRLPLLTLGRTASEIKSTVGAEAYQLICYVKHRNPVSNRLIKPFIDSIKVTEWIPRNPFKEVAVQTM